MEKISIDSGGWQRRRKIERAPLEKGKYNLGARENSSASCEQRFFPITITITISITMAIPYHPMWSHPMAGWQKWWWIRVGSSSRPRSPFWTPFFPVGVDMATKPQTSSAVLTAAKVANASNLRVLRWLVVSVVAAEVCHTIADWLTGMWGKVYTVRKPWPGYGGNTGQKLRHANI